MTPILADVASHRVRFAWLGAAVSASVVLAMLALQPAPAPTTGELRVGGCSKARRHMRVPLGQVHGGLPADCVHYIDQLSRFAACPQLPAQSRRAMDESARQALQSWTSLPLEARAELSRGCRMAITALDEAAAATQCQISDIDRDWTSYIADHGDTAVILSTPRAARGSFSAPPSAR